MKITALSCLCACRYPHCGGYRGGAGCISRGSPPGVCGAAHEKVGLHRRQLVNRMFE